MAPPATVTKDWPQSPIDSFILAELERRGLVPAEPADKRTLLRRATFDLTGLPPTPDQIAGFLADDSPEAFAKVVDRLLASAHYGERWGRHWLDVVRYADARDLIQLPAESDFREAWRYRDWVVEAFNRDVPYNAFIAQQIAGDLMQPADASQIDKDALVATGFLALADFVPGDVNKEQMIADYVNDQIDVVGRAILGLTLGCARCHNHKFDPISIEDYYSLAGIFFSTRLIPGPVAGNTPLVRADLVSPAELQAIGAQTARDGQRMAELTRETATFADREYLSRLKQQVAGETPRYLVAAWELEHRPSSEPRPVLEEFAAARGLDATTLTRWLRFLDLQSHPPLAPARATADKAACEQWAAELGRQLAALAEHRQLETAQDPIRKQLADAEMFRFRADDPRIVASESREVLSWPDRAGLADDATRFAGGPGPVLVTADVGGRSRQVVRFHGWEQLGARGGVPTEGSLFVVFRTSEKAAAGQRLLGWEDASVGQHGVGLMPDANGSVHAIVRKGGASGDVVIPASTASDFQLLALTWGPAGVTAHRDGAPVGMNGAIDAVSSDPDIKALCVGGPGSGAGPGYRGDLAELRVYSIQVDDPARARIEAELQERWFGPPDAIPLAVDPLADLYDELMSPRGPYWTSEADRAGQLSESTRRTLSALNDELEALKKKPKAEIPRAVVVKDGGPPGTSHEGFRDAQVYLRGDPARPGKTVGRGFPRVLAGDAQPPIQEGSGRRELAAWLTSADHPLTARVMINRIWQHHFGEGLVRTSTNFGARGEAPSHPELLDYLASRFVRSGWSVKSMHRLMMLTSAYQQSTRASTATLTADPENRLLSRMNRRRLEAEAIRDCLLAVSGKLEGALGGPGFFEVATPRRSLYLMSVRTGAKAADFGPLFDGPDCSAVVERRSQSTVAPQALFLLNDPVVMDQASGLATRLARELPAAGPRERIERLYTIALGRMPTASEVEIGIGMLVDGPEADAWASYCHVILCTNEFVYVD